MWLVGIDFGVLISDFVSFALSQLENLRFHCFISYVLRFDFSNLYTSYTQTCNHLQHKKILNCCCCCHCHCIQFHFYSQSTHRYSKIETKQCKAMPNTQRMRRNGYREGIIRRKNSNELHIVERAYTRRDRCNEIVM